MAKKKTKKKEAEVLEAIAPIEALEVVEASSIEAEAIEAEAALNAPEFNEEELLAIAQKEGLVDETAPEADLEEAEEAEIDMALEDQNHLIAAMETLLFMSDKAMTLSKMRSTIDPEIKLAVYRTLFRKLREDFASDHRGVEIAEVAGGYQLRTKPQMAQILRKMVKTQPMKLTSTALETLAVIAYKQPLVKDEVDRIRGVDSGYAIRNLLEKRLVKIVGRSEAVGRPMLYSTSHEFLELFNLKDLQGLPALHEIEALVAASEIGAEDEEEAKLREFRPMIEATATVLFEEGGLDTQIEELRSTIAAIPTSTDFIERQKRKEKLSASLNAPNLSDEKRATLQAELSELELLDNPVETTPEFETAAANADVVAEFEANIAAADAAAETIQAEALIEPKPTDELPPEEVV